jgi:WD40 repeat protein
LKPIRTKERWRPEDRAYRVFISYKHSDSNSFGSDSEFSRWLQRRLEAYTFPRKLVGVTTSTGIVPARLGSVFRDEDYLPAGPELDVLIERALRRSENLVVLCSPAAAASPWVSKEIAFFKSLQTHSMDGDGISRPVFALIVDGEPHAPDPRRECFPPALKVQVDAAGHMTSIPANPLAPDIRRDGRENAVLRLIAGLCGLDFEDLIAREEQRRREFRRRSIFFFAVGIVLSALAFVGLTGTVFMGWRNALARSDLIAAYAGQAMLGSRTEEGLLIGLSAAPPASGNVLPLRPAAQQAIASAVIATENLKVVLQDSGLEVRVVKPFHQSSLVLTAGMDGAAKLFDIHSGKTIRALRESGQPIRLGAVSPDDKLIAVAPTSGPVLIWVAEDTSPPFELAFDRDEPTSIEFSPDNRWLVVASAKAIRMWRIGDWLNVHEIDSGGMIVAISPDGTKLIVGNGEGAVAGFAIEGGPALWQKQTHESSITGLAFASDGTRLMTSSLDRSAKLLDPVTGEQLSQPMRASGPILAAAFSPDSGMVATTSADGTVELFDGKSGRNRLFYPTNAGWTAALAFSRDGKLLAVGSRNRTITVIRTSDAKGDLVLRGHQGEVLALSFSGSSGELVSGGSDGSIRVWSVVDRRTRCEVNSRSLEGRKVVLASTADIAAVQGRNGTIGIFRLFDCTRISTLDTHSDTISSMAISPDGSQLALLTSRGWEIWATASGTPITEVKLDSANSVALSMTELAVAVGTKVKLWSLSETKQPQRNIELPQDIQQIAISPDGQFIGAILVDGTFAVTHADGSVVGLHPSSLKDATWIVLSLFGNQALLGNEGGAVMLIRNLADNAPAETFANNVSTAQFYVENAIVYLSFDGMLHALDTNTLDELYTYRSVPRTETASNISPNHTLVSLGDFGNEMTVRNVLPVGPPLVAYGCKIRPVGSERVLATQAFQKLSASLGLLLPCDTSSIFYQLLQLVTFATDRRH